MNASAFTTFRFLMVIQQKCIHRWIIHEFQMNNNDSRVITQIPLRPKKTLWTTNERAMNASAFTISRLLTVIQQKCVHRWMSDEFHMNDEWIMKKYEHLWTTNGRAMNANAFTISRIILVSQQKCIHSWMNDEWTTNERAMNATAFTISRFHWYFNKNAFMNEWWMNHEWTRDKRNRVHDFPIPLVL